MNDRETAQVCALLAGATGWQPKPDTVRVWQALLADVPFGAGMAAARVIGTRMERWPSVAALRRQVAAAAGLLAPDFDEAFEQALDRDAAAHPAVVKARDLVGDQFYWRTGTPLDLRLAFREWYLPAKQRHDGDAVLAFDGAALGAGESMKQLPGGLSDG